MNEFNVFLENLKLRLQEPLPAWEAHQKMAPSNRLNLDFKPNDRTRRSAVLILFYPYRNQIFLPLILRPAYDGVHGGQMAFPGGRYEKEDKTLIQTALREAQEEIGIKLSDVTVLGQLTELFIPPSNFWVQPVVGFLTKRPDFYPDEREVDSVFEISIDELSNPSIIAEKKIDLRGFDINAPYYDIFGNHVWGATAMMISELLAVIGGQSKKSS
jgi:8-oxo-dGTP pyrophosphatase MutT (NUDIX family)